METIQIYTHVLGKGFAGVRSPLGKRKVRNTGHATAPTLHAAVASAIRAVVPSFLVAALPGHLQRPLDKPKQV
ncbi:hypothetical protein [Halomonas cerina]|uniref:hypothetical protein n=1 Tax=Halomonas cerina TaxID=447424 RepID=UPI003CCD5A67